jgi:hypothetical protein
MRNILYFFLILLSILISTCSSDKQSKDSLPYIDIGENYPEKEILLTDIADITYLYLNSDDDEYLYRGMIQDITENTIVVYDNVSGSILFFSKDGMPKSRFNHQGQGPNEYIFAKNVVYDENTDDVFVLSALDAILVYSSTGEYKRILKLPEGTFINPFISFDDESLLIYNSRADTKRMAQDENDLPADLFYIPYIHISKTDAKVLNYTELYSEKIALKDNISGAVGRTSRMVRCKEGALLCNPETDTVFLYSKTGSLIPLIHKIPSTSKMDPMIYMNNCVDVGKYQFMELFTVRREEGAFPFPVKYIMRDKKTGEVVRPKITLPDYMGKEFFISPVQSGTDYENGYYYDLDLIELKQAYRENKLSGKLKELVATLNEEEDNNVFVMVDFK